MNKKIVRICAYIFLIVISLFISGCDVMSFGLTDIVSNISDFFNNYMPDIQCWFIRSFFGIINQFGTSLSFIFNLLASTLPDVTLPVINVSSYSFVGYAAYFFPISESVTLMKYMLGFYLTWKGIRILLRTIRIFR